MTEQQIIKTEFHATGTNETVLKDVQSIIFRPDANNRMDDIEIQFDAGKVSVRSRYGVLTVKPRAANVIWVEREGY